MHDDQGTTTPVLGLAYVGVETPEAQRWRDVGPGVFGFQVVDDTPPGVIQLKMDERHHRLEAVHGEQNRLSYLGWEVTSGAALEAIADRAEAAGLPVVRDDPSLRDKRHYKRVATFTDPFGYRHELAVGSRDESTFTPGRHLEGRFITGDGGMGHAVLILPNREQAKDFYTSVLGFELSDTINQNGLEIWFFHVNPRHHTIAFVEVPGMRGLHHLMFEVSQLDDVGHAFNLLPEFEVPIAMTLGRHPNDRMFSFYARVPGGFEIEYGQGALRIRNDLPWETKHFDVMSEWGHKPNPDLGPPGTLEPVENYQPPASAPAAAAPAKAKVASSNGQSSPSGTWKTLTKTPMGDQRGTLEIVVEQNAVSGTLTGPGGTIPIYNGSFDGDILAWKVDVTQPLNMTLEFSATVAAEEMNGSVKAGNFGTSPFSASKALVAAR